MRALPFPTRPFDASAATGGKNLGDLPEWDLSDLYASQDTPDLGRDMEDLEQACAAFAAKYEGQLAGLDAKAMLDCIEAYEKIELTAGRIMSFAGLRYYQNTTDAARAQFYQNCQEKITDFTAPLVFFTLEMNRIEADRFEALFAASAALARYKPVFDRMRAMRPYQLSDELEKFLHDQSSVGAAAWNKLFDETIAGLGFSVDGEEMNLEATLNLLTEPERDRRDAGVRAWARVFLTPASRSRRFPAAPRRSSAGRIRPRSAAPARRTC